MLQPQTTSKFPDTSFELNIRLRVFEEVKNILDRNNIPFTKYDPLVDYGDPKEYTVVFGCEVPLSVIQFVSRALHEKFHDLFKIYISYIFKFDSPRHKVRIGTYDLSTVAYTNLSRPINPSEIAILDISSLSWTMFEQLFPNTNYFAFGNQVPAANVDISARPLAAAKSNSSDSFSSDSQHHFDFIHLIDTATDNPWVEVLGDNEDAETAYWNTD